MHSSHRSPQQITPGKIRIIALTLLTGLVVFTVVTAVLTAGGEGLASSGPADPNAPQASGDDGLDILKWIALAMLALMTPVGFLLRTGRLRVAAEMEDEQAAGEVYAGASLLFFAVIEGAALFNIVVWLLLGDPVPNAFAAGLAMLLMVVNLPSEAAFKRLRELRGLLR